MLPAVRVALNRLSVLNRLTYRLDVAEPAFTVKSDFGFTGGILRARLSGMTILEASMFAVLHGCVAA